MYRLKIGGTGRLAERRTAKRIGATLTPNSGAMDSAKGDMRAAGYLIEAKSTVTETLGVKLDWLAKITQEARTRSEKPAVTLTFTTGDGQPRRFGSWVLIPEHVFQRLITQEADGGNET